MTTLRKGQKFLLHGQRWRVAYVNASRAHCLAIVRAPVTVRDRRTWAERTFHVKRQLSMDISPTSSVELFAELGAA